ncbi:MAG: FGGY-family carbohydrate kinase [Nitrosospira sp.]|nr:FGGY-family carbohydrate kinase [Nitrosospira sp.]
MIIAHDLGTTSNKASLHSDDGKMLQHCTVSYPAHFASGGVAEQNPMDWWGAIGTASKKLLQMANIFADQISGVGISGQMMGAIFLDENFIPTRDAIIWADFRSQKQSDYLIEKIGLEKAYKRLGHRLNPTYSIAKVMWVRDNQPGIWSKTKHICIAKDFINQKLSGKFVTEPSDASSTNCFDQINLTWDQEILGVANIPVSYFPEVVPSTSIIGGLTKEAAIHTGLNIGTPVVAGGGDGPMAALGAGIIYPSDGAYACIGSSSWVAVSTDKPLHDTKMRSMTWNHIVPNQYSPTATMQAGGASLQWIVEDLMPISEKDRYKILLSEAEKVSASDDGLYFLPHILGERSPYWNPSAAGAFIGLGRHHDRSYLVRAVLEGVAFNLLTCIQAFTENGIPIKQVDVIGGGAESSLWLQIFADVWGVKVRSRSIVEDANSLGAAVTTLVALGKGEFSMVKELSTITGEFNPSSTSQKFLQQHQIFLDGYYRLEEWFLKRKLT